MERSKDPIRIDSLDILRGLVCVLMAIDHVRVYSGVPAGGPTAGVFFTRWVTHFVAPAFCFLAGTGAFLHGRRLGDLRALSRFLVTRGLVLVVLELTLIKLVWTFGLRYDQLTLMGVIWMLGWCMVGLGVLLRVIGSPRTLGFVGLGIIALQQLFSLVPRALPASTRASVGWLWEFIYPAGLETPGSISVLYVLVPWLGVMAAGYGFGLILLRADEDRRRLCLRIGLGATALFLVAGGLQASLASGGGDGESPSWLFRLLDQDKYPASQLFLLMTLGPMIALIPLAERWRGRAASVLRTFGRVPMWYYLLHIPLIHAVAIVVMRSRGAFDPAWYATAPYAQVPPEQRWPLWLLWLVWALCVAALYPACAWYARVKRERPAPWMSYI